MRIISMRTIHAEYASAVIGWQTRLSCDCTGDYATFEERYEVGLFRPPTRKSVLERPFKLGEPTWYHESFRQLFFEAMFIYCLHFRY